MHGGGALHAFERPVDRRHAEPPRLVRMRLQERLVELDHVGAGREQVLDLLVQRDGAVHRDGGVVLVVLVEQLLRHGERAGNGDLDRPVGVGAQERHVPDLHRPAGAGSCPPPAARSESCPACARESAPGCRCPCRRARWRSGWSSFRAVFRRRDDVDAGALLIADRQYGGVVLRLFEPGRDRRATGRSRGRAAERSR